MEIEIKTVRTIRIALSILLIINGILWFLGHLDKLTAFNLAYSIFMVAVGNIFIFFLTDLEKILISINDDSIFIKWHGRVLTKEVPFKSIDSVYLRKVALVIVRKGKKRLKFTLDNLEVLQKKDIYDYFIRLSKVKEINVVRRFED
jgi:hypothetical protein